MLKILNKYINKMGTGLFLLDAPTGFGKTTAVINYINSILANDVDIKKKIFFITNLKKNIPIDDFKRILGKEKYKKYCLFLKPYHESIIENWEKVNIENKSITSDVTYRQLDNAVKSYNEIKKSDNENSFQILSTLKEQIERQYEPKFRDFIKKMFFYSKTTEEKKKYIKQNEWVRILYPSTCIEDYKIILMSTNKFMTPIDCFYKIPFHIYNDSLIKDSIVFIDEFDSSKSTLLDCIINDGLKLKIDVIKLFINIYHALINVKIPKQLEEQSKDVKKRIEDYKYKTIREIIDVNTKIFEEVFGKYKLNFLLKTKDIKEDKAFLFSDGNYITVTKDNSRSKLVTEIDEEKLNQRIVRSKSKVNEEDIEVKNFIKDLIYSIDHFVVGLNWASNDYQSYVNETRGDNENYFTIEESIRSILSIFYLSEEHMEYLSELISIEHFESKIYNKVNYDKDDGFMKKGLSFLEIEDSDYHNLQSVFHMFKFDLTPEELLLRICNSSKVIGVSATATLDTVNGNFDLKYLKSKLKEKLYLLEDEDQKELNNKFEEQQKNYDEVDIEVDICDKSIISSNRDQCNSLIKSIIKESARDKYYKYVSEIKNDNKLYYFLVTLKLGYAYKQFIDKKLNSFVCFLNSLHRNKSTENKFDRLIIEDINELFLDISNEKINIKYVKSENFDVEMNKIKNELFEGKKCFVITTYQTLGSGKNIQYDIPNGIEKNMIINDKERYQKDFDGVYLMCPTNLIVDIKYDNENKYYNLSKFLFQQEYLGKRKLISYATQRNNIKNAFKKTFFKDSYAPINSKDGDLLEHTAKILIQAVGRICRCRNKNKKILIITELENIYRIQGIKDELEKRALNKEFISLLNKNIESINLDIQKYSDQNKQCKRKLDLKAYRVRDSKENIEEWKELREWALKFPTFNDGCPFLEPYYLNFPFKVDFYAYEIGNNFNFSKFVFKKYYNYHQVSSSDSELDRLMEIDYLMNYFKDKGYAVEFKKCKKIMSLSFYKQIYLGALGEVAGKCIIEKELGIKLEEIDDISMFELFDYKYGNCYLDFKHWREYEKENDEYVNKIIKKLEKIKGSKCIIINLFKRGENKGFIENLGENVIQIPWLINDENEIDLKQIALLKLELNMIKE